MESSHACNCRTKKELEKIAGEFAEKWNMPNCIEDIDGKHIDIITVPNSVSYYFNYNK